MAAVLGVSSILLRASAASGSDPVAIVSVSPAALDSSLVCGVVTRGLPDAPSRETLQSGLPSALVFGFSLLDASGKAVGGSRAEIRIEPDLWEKVVFLRTPIVDHRLTSLGEVQAMLARVNPLPVLPLSRLEPTAPYRLRVRLAVHPLAPSEIRRTRGLITGESDLEDPDRREISVGLDSVLRFFLGPGEEEPWVAEVTSAFFSRHELPEATLPEPQPAAPEERNPEGN
jgi:hypothetical protein